MSYYSQRQINNFRAYEMIRSSGEYNMFSSQARLASCLSKEDYTYVMENYSALKDASEAAAADEMLLKAVDHS
jgi:hypothetical protein